VFLGFNVSLFLFYELGMHTGGIYDTEFNNYNSNLSLYLSLSKCIRYFGGEPSERRPFTRTSKLKGRIKVDNF
jgi:hypothetical protein